MGEQGRTTWGGLSQEFLPLGSNVSGEVDFNQWRNEEVRLYAQGALPPQGPPGG